MKAVLFSASAAALLALASPAFSQDNGTGGQLQYGQVQYGPMQYAPPQYGPVQYAPVQYAPMQYRAPDYGQVQYGPLQYPPVQYAPMQYPPVQYGPVQYGQQQPAAPEAQAQQCVDGESGAPVACAPPDPAAERASGEGMQFDDGYDPQAHTRFEAALASHGSWVEAAGYGRVWVPSVAEVGAEFVPYGTGGHWALTEAGWTWVSAWEWGWAPFHYGRWLRAPQVGWCWVPGTVWGPSWVSWRRVDNYVGWAALPPVGLSGASFDNRVGSAWRFVPVASMGQPRLPSVSAAQANALLGRAEVVDRPFQVSLAGSLMHINAGPVLPGVTPSSIAAFGLRVLPHGEIVAQPGAALEARPWMQSNALGTALNPQRGVQPIVGAVVHPSYVRAAEMPAPAGATERPAPVFLQSGRRDRPAPVTRQSAPAAPRPALRPALVAAPRSAAPRAR